ncbi:hypothetical protein PRZ48_005240 [Zasmidium cellare]|uniref:Uncharacterized protein n=1 Tax=Zasmidium cellare TaxID=395010 RepID=A0ABR0ERW4_ZASCE|nr:hypothetical protein PRZ48_005240 [Zasmidium cellare]
MAATNIWDPTANAFDNGPALRKQKGNKNRPSKGYRAATRVRERLLAKQRQIGGDSPLFDDLPKQPQVCIQETAIARFFHDYVLDGSAASCRSRPNAGYLAHIPGMYLHSKSGSSFALALSAAANANFWRRHNSDQARSQSMQDCGAALLQLREDLDHRESPQDIGDLLAASAMLATYQLIVTRDVSQRTSWTAHVNGAVALLGREEQGHQQLGDLGEVMRPIVLQMLADCLIMGRHPKLPLETCASVMAQTTSHETLFAFKYRTAELCANGIGGCSVDSVDPAQQTRPIINFLERCQALDEEMSNWMQFRLDLEPVAILPNTKDNVPAALRAMFSSPGAPTVLHLCADMNQTHQWHNYRACRLTILRAMMNAINTATALATDHTTLSNYELVREEVHSRAAGLIDELLSTVFSSLAVGLLGKAQAESMTDIEGFRAFQILWPLHIAGTCLKLMGQHYPSGCAKLGWIRSLFRCIRDEMGIQAANSFLQVQGG